MTVLKDITTPKQLADLASAGITTLYQLVTYFPFRVETIHPMTSIIEDNQLYICEGIIQSIHQKSHSSPLVIEINVDARVIMLYYFGRGEFVRKSLHIGHMYQFLCIKKNSFLNVRRFSQKREPLLDESFVLGRSQIKHIIQPVYERSKQLSNTLLQQIHRKIPRSGYILDVTGLLPHELLGDNIDLFFIHHPQSVSSWFSAKQKWNTMHVFLNTMLIRYIQKENNTKKGIISTLDISTLRSITKTLPYSLSNSQKLAIWEILQDIACSTAEPKK